MNLVPLFEEALEFQDYNGTVLSDGKVAVYYIGRTRLADIYTDVEGSVPAENPRILNNLGMGPVYVNPAFDYEMVVFDTYGSELFSVKKYLASKGEHSTANVVVTPSESIAVSAWTVGDVQVYMPYLTGQLGKVYTGIEPIVVNNVEDKISANHVPLGVQDPLYFVQDDEECCIIGFSGETLPEGTMNESAFGYQDGQITSYNGSAFSAGNSYEAGSYVDIDGNTINVTGLQPAGEYVTSGDLDEYTKRTDFNDAISSLNSSKLDVDVYSSQSALFLTALPSDVVYSADITGLATTAQLNEKLDKADSANFYPMDSNPSGYINELPSDLATTGFVADVSGDITAMIPSTAGLATENWVSSQGYLTAHQSLDGLMSADLLEISDNKITGYNGTAFAGQGGVTGDYELSAGSGISIVDYPLEQKTVISVTAQGGNPEVEQAVIDNSATWNTVSNKLDTTAFSDVSGTFLTAHQSLADYQTTAGMTAYQPAGAYLTTADSANFYTTANESGFITGVPAGTMNESAFSYDASDNITAYNGSAFKAGDEFPQSATEAIETVTANSADWNGTTETVSSNSGAWGGEALPISAGPGIKLGMVNNTLVASTVGYVWQSASLFHTDTPAKQTTYTLSDSCSNYDKIEVDFYDVDNWRTQMDCPIPHNLDASGTRGGYFSVVPASTATGATIWFKAFNWTAAGTTWSCYCSELSGQGGSNTQHINANQPDNPPKVVNIIGWKRVGGN